MTAISSYKRLICLPRYALVKILTDHEILFDRIHCEIIEESGLRCRDRNS